MSSEKYCKKCGENSLEKLFVDRWKGKEYYRNICKKCRNKQVKEWQSLNPERFSATSAKHAKKVSKNRRELVDIPRYIHIDSRKSDKRKGFENDLTKGFIEELIEPGCSYCDETELRMTLDRIDNSRGHTQDNVVAACIRCNYVRKTMPYKAWLLVAKRMKIARVQGLFGDWTGRAR